MNSHTKNDVDSLVIKVAKTNEEKRGAYRLRYDVFTRELNDGRYADHDLQEFRDSDDVEGAFVFIALEKANVVGTFRLKPLGNMEVIGVEAYGIPTLAKQLGVSLDSLRKTLAVIDRFTVSSDYRGKSLFKQLFSFVEAFAVERGVCTLVGAAESKRAVALYMRALGCSKYSVVGTRNRIGGG